jgi:hypothetical protein
MYKSSPFTRALSLVAIAALVLRCSDAVSPAPGFLGTPEFSVAIDRQNGTLNEQGIELGTGFHPTNPHHGDAVIATFFWLGSTNVIASVTDRLSSGTPVGNTYNLVEYVTAGPISMATYVATNVQNFPDPNNGPEEVLVVSASLSTSVTDGGALLSSYSGVTPVYADALGAHRSSSGTGSTETTAHPGAITADAGAVVYGVTMSDGLVGITTPTNFTNISTMSDASIKGSGEFAVQGSAGSVDPQWTWFFNAPRTWLASSLALRATPPIGRDTANGHFNAVNATDIRKGFDAKNPDLGDAVVATFFWVGSTNTITRVWDHLSDDVSTPIGNTYTLVDYVTDGEVSMATYVATNVRNYPVPGNHSSEIFVVQADFSSAVPYGGIQITAYRGVNTVTSQALGPHSYATGSGPVTVPTVADPGAVTVGAGELMYGVSMTGTPVGVDLPAGFAEISTQSNLSSTLKGSAVDAVQTVAGSVHPQWTWHFEQGAGNWLANALVLKP